MEDEPKRPLLAFVRGANHVVNLVALLLVLALGLYSAYSVWYMQSLLDGSFLSDELAMFKPNGREPTLEELKSQNADVRAWITIDGTHIDYPVVQGATDAEYLNKSVEGEFSLAGAIYLSALNTPDFSDPYNMVYGHHVDGGAMFSDVLEFRDKDFFDAHPTGILWLSESEALAIEVFACMDVDGLDEVVYQDSGRVEADALPGLVDDVVGRSVQSRAVDIMPGDSIIALSTCEDALTFERVVLFGELVPMTPEEVAAAQAKNAAEEGALASQASGQEAPGLLARHPWLLPAGGVLLVVLLLFALRRARSH